MNPKSLESGNPGTPYLIRAAQKCHKHIMADGPWYILISASHPHHPERRSTTANPLLLDTPNSIGHFKEMLGRAIRRKKPRSSRINGTTDVWFVRDKDKFMMDFVIAGT